MDTLKVVELSSYKEESLKLKK